MPVGLHGVSGEEGGCERGRKGWRRKGGNEVEGKSIGDREERGEEKSTSLHAEHG